MMRRGLLLAMTIAVAMMLAACGRATDEQINQALGITPTPTLTAGGIASATAAATATAEARALALASPAGGGGAALGDVTVGARQFTTWCSGCHGPGGSGPDILKPGVLGAAATSDSFQTLLRDGDGHPTTYKITEIDDKQINDLAAYINSKSGQ
ncbi:MAG: cytochrome c [Thermomicrobiales bacterium]|nr:cytochrome c [Thermomicrobiales bacterium]